MNDDDRGAHEAMFDELSVSDKIAFGRACAVMLDNGALPHSTVSRTAVRKALDNLYGLGKGK